MAYEDIAIGAKVVAFHAIHALIHPHVLLYSRPITRNLFFFFELYKRSPRRAAGDRLQSSKKKQRLRVIGLL